MAEFYRFTNGNTMRREDGYQWHLRDSEGNLLDHDRYRHDIIERRKLKIESNFDPDAVMALAERTNAEANNWAGDDAAKLREIADGLRAIALAAGSVRRRPERPEGQRPTPIRNTP